MEDSRSPRITSSFLVIAAFLLAQVPFSLAEWVAVPTAPGQSGVYDLVIRAVYNNVTGTFPLEIQVSTPNGNAASLGNISVEPVYPFGRTPPILLRYDIAVNGSRNFTMEGSNVTVYYASGDTLISSQPQSLTQGDDSYWYVSVNVPFKGEYRAAISLDLVANGQRYSGEFMSYFESESASQDLALNPQVSPRVLTPAESFTATLGATFEGIAIPGLGLFKANLYGELKDLSWDGEKGIYDASFTAPTDEGIYLLSVYAEGQDFLNQIKTYVVEISQPKSARCPIALNISSGCTDMKDVRKCVSDWKSGAIEVSEDSLASCFESASGGLVYGSVICDGTYKGDLDGDKEIEIDDIELLQSSILPLVQSVRKDYVKCADYDLDGDVDAGDLTCLTMVAAKAWFGDTKGGICLDANYDSPLKGDLDNSQFIDQADVGLMYEISRAADNGVTMPQKVLDAIDFNQDGNINLYDRDCLNYFVGMKLGDPSTLLAGGQTIPASCMKIYRLDNCQDIGGDLNGDIRIDALDEILIMLIDAHQVTGYDMGCADVNTDSVISDEDVICVKSYLQGDLEAYYTCLHCDEYTPSAYRFEYEICGDGYDNDCNGLIDRTSTNPADDWCLCNKNTPCWMVWDNDAGTVPGIDDGNVRVCRKMSWEGGDNTDNNGTTNSSNSMATSGGAATYRWTLPIELLCTQDRECESINCDKTGYKCAFDGSKWDWYERPSDLPDETDDPLASPKLCEDTYDNDCSCGDTKCKELEAGNMFSSVFFWVGVVVGAVLSIIGVGVLIMAAIMVGGSLISNAIGCTECSAFFAGVSVGYAVGNLGQAAYSMATAPATVTTTVASTAPAAATAAPTTVASVANAIYTTVSTAVMDFFTAVMTATSSTSLMLQFGVAGALTKKAALKYAESEAEWKAQAQTCSG